MIIGNDITVLGEDESGTEDLKSKIAEMKERYGTNCLIMNSPKVDAASSEIRKMVLEGMDVSEYVGKEVSDYIKQKKLYVTV